MRPHGPHTCRAVAGAIIGVLLSGLVAGTPAVAAHAFSVSKDDYKLDTAVAIYFEDAAGNRTPYVFSADGKLMQMLMCKATLDSALPKIIRAVQAPSEYKGRKVLGAKCTRTSKKPIDLFP